MPVKGDTDSEKFFYYLLSGNNAEMNLDWLRNKILKLTNFSGANFILTNGKTTYLANWYTLNPLYYTMKILQQKESVLVSSEKLPHYEKADWRNINNHSLFSIRAADLSFQQ